MISSLIVGSTVTHLVAGLLAKKMPVKLLMLVIMAVSSIVTILIPVMADVLGSGGVIGCRIVTGLAQGFLLPVAQAIISTWAPLPEISRFSTFVYSGKGMFHR